MSTDYRKKIGPRELAERLKQDIRHRELAVRDRYLTDAEAGRMLGVSTTMAHRAMRLLVEQRVVERQGRAGTFISEDFGAKPRSRMSTAYVLMRVEWEEMGYKAYGEIISGIRNALPGTNVQFSFVPVVDPGGYTRELIASAKSRGETVGFLAMSCRRDVYLALAESGMPTVVSGTLHPGDPVLPSLDNDPERAGHLLARHLLDRGHRNLLLVNAMEMRPGDNAFYDGISEEITKANLPHNSLVIRCIPHDLRGFTATIGELLARDARPTGVICLNLFAADLVTEAIASLGAKATEQIEVAGAAATIDDWEKPRPYWYTRIKASKAERAGLLGQMLARVSRGESLEPHEQRVVMPLTLIAPQ
ncbi:MAG: substrate-binding domain-containing protein [Pirellulales bacterium]|nr:substrate-binding domain-containing protein [Pirellulales bacterium]